MTDQSPPPPGEWVLLEVFGHRRHWGLLSEVERFGTKMARIDEYRPDDAAPVSTLFYGGASIFSIRPEREAFARLRTAERWGCPVPALPAPADPDDDYPDDEDGLF